VLAILQHAELEALEQRDQLAGIAIEVGMILIPLTALAAALVCLNQIRRFC